jgi:TolB-like protein/Tfp pilus assembly protein PilF
MSDGTGFVGGGRRGGLCSWRSGVRPGMVLAVAGLLVAPACKPGDQPQAVGASSTSNPAPPKAPAKVSTASAAPSAPAVPDDVPAKSVAVRPFAATGAGGGVALADALTEDVIRELGAVPELEVISRTSTFALRSDKIAPADVGRRLRVRYLVDGVLEGAAEPARLTVRLVQTNSGTVKWTQTFDAAGKPLPALAVTVAAAVARELGATVETRAAGPGVKPEAYQIYAQGRQAWHLGTAEGRDKAEEAFNKAIALEPEFAPAHASLAAVWLVRGQTEGDRAGFSRANPAFLPNIVAQLKKAIDLEPRLAEAHALLGDAYAGAWQADEAQRSLDTAIRLNRNDASAHRWLAQVMESEGRLEDALAEHHRAVELDPLSVEVATDYARALVFAGQSSVALERLNVALALQPDNAQARCWRAWALVDLQRMPEAVEEGRRLAKKGGPMESTFAAAVLYRGGQRREADEAFKQIPVSVKTSVYYLLAVTGRRDDVIALMAPSIARPAELSLLMYLPVFDPLRGHPRFREILRDAGAGAAHTRAQAERARVRETHG